jgi:hypothetical protein
LLGDAVSCSDSFAIGLKPQLPRTDVDDDGGLLTEDDDPQLGPML